MYVFVMVFNGFGQFLSIQGTKAKANANAIAKLTLKPNFSIVRNFVSCFTLYLSSAEPWDPSLPLLCWGQ